MQSVILAAGRGTRLGGPKALLAWPLLPQRWLVPLAIAHLEALASHGPALVVVRAEVGRALGRHAPLAFSSQRRLVISDAADALGPAGSIAAAMPALDLSETRRVLIMPVDVPPVSGALVRALAAALDEGARAARPVHAGRGGHPVVVSAPLLAPYLEPEPPPLRELLRSLGAARADVVVDDPQVTMDIDTPDDLARWSREYGAGAIEAPAFFTLD